MNKLFYPILFLTILFSVESPSDKYLTSIDVDNRLGNKISGDIQIVDQDNNMFQLNHYLKDKPTVLLMAYYECPMLCSMMLNGLSNVINDSNLIPGEDYNVLTVSIDPKETSKLSKEKKNNYMSNYFSESNNDFWTFTTSSADNINQLANELGFKYSYDTNTNQYAHPAVIYIITEDGTISHHLFGVSPSANDFTLAINEAAGGKIASVFDKILLYCYKYNPDAGTYSLVAANVMKLAGVSTLFAMFSFLSFFWYRESKV